MSEIRNHPYDPVMVFPVTERVVLQIGEAERGKCRYAYLEPDEARRVGVALIAAAESVKPQHVPTPYRDRLVAAFMAQSENAQE
jgi:hypothetical protein